MARRPGDIPDASLRLALTRGLGPVTWRRLRERFGDDDTIVGASVNTLMEIKGIGQQSAETLRRAIDAAQPRQERDRMEAAGVQLLLLGDADYPPLLASIDDAPTAIWIRGRLSDEDQVSIALVGSRKCTPYGREQSERLSVLLAQSGLTIVSGGALGIDAAAHRGALRAGGRTIVVLGCGVDRAYPPEHEQLFKRIVADDAGAVISEYPMGVDPLAKHFPRRNRIISGLSLGVLLIEAATRSGALITARLAAEEHHREVMALPGRVDSPASAGALKLIRDGGAALVVDHADVIQQLESTGHLLRAAVGQTTHADTEATLFTRGLTPDQQRIVEVLTVAREAMETDRLAAQTCLPVGQLMADLTLLEIRRVVRRTGRGIELRSA